MSLFLSTGICLGKEKDKEKEPECDHQQGRWVCTGIDQHLFQGETTFTLPRSFLSPPQPSVRDLRQPSFFSRQPVCTSSKLR
ncbi:MAG TPA: hypothetical protein VNJ29_02410 [Candidatus Nitrosotenuis sp.]|nr:hypothetical protein [Candidatus Nitrosotenuis sp.]